MGSWIVGVLLVAAVLLTVVGPAVAQQQGVAIDVGRIDVDEELVAGQRYQLPTIRVRNPGTITSGYRMGVQPIAGSDAPAEGWFVFSPASFELDPDGRQPVEVALEVPLDAAGGEYAALVAAQVVPGADGATVGAAAASRLTFRIAATAEVETVEVEDAEVEAAGPDVADPASRWWLWVALGVLLLVLLWLLARRYNVRIERRR